MSLDKSKLNSKAVGAAALVALSGFVPTPLVNMAQAATATISVTGSFITGIKLAAGTTAKFGVNAATDINGKLTLSTAGAIAAVKAVHVSGKQAGSFAFTAVSTVPSVDITVSGLGALTLTKTVGGVGPTGTAKLTSIILGKIGAAATTIADAGGGTGKKAGYDITKKTTKLLVGGIVTWGGTAPIGTFTTPITLTISY